MTDNLTPEQQTCTDRCKGVPGIRGLLEHVGIDTSGRDITVDGRLVDAAPAPTLNSPAEISSNLASGAPADATAGLVEYVLAHGGEWGPSIVDEARAEVRAELAPYLARLRQEWDAELAHALVEVETWREHYRHTEAHLRRVEDVRDAAIRHRDELAAELARLGAQVARIRTLHRPVGVVAAAEAGMPPDCATCGPDAYPCPTIRALDDTPTPENH
jgi:hypothetical protein